MLYARVKERVPKDAWTTFRSYYSRVRKLEDKPRILWFQDTSQDPEVQFLKKKEERDKFDRFVFPSDWSLEKYNLDWELNMKRVCVLKNAIEPIPAHAKPKRGRYDLHIFLHHIVDLDVLIGAFVKHCKIGECRT